MTDEEKEQVRAATDAVALVGETVVLRQRGNDFWGCCPFHQEKSPSFHVNANTGLWHCFGCHKGGDVFAYVMEREGLDFIDAARFLADRAGIELTEGPGQRGPRRIRLSEALGEAERFYATMLLRGRGEAAAAARSYLAHRGFGFEVCRRWGLGYAPGGGTLVSELRGKGFTAEELDAADLCVSRNGRLVDRFFDRVMFPIHDETGRAIGFGGRVMGDGKPKYLNTRETALFHKHKHLFALDHAKAGITASGMALVVEGYTDAIALHEAGYTNTVAVLGTALSIDHIRLLERHGAKTIVCMFDGDAAGQRAAELTVRHLDNARADLRCALLPDNLDPAEFVEAYGADALREYVRRAEPLVDFVLDRRLAAYDLRVPGQRSAALDDAAELLAPLRLSPLLDSYATNLAFRLGRQDVEAVKRVIRSKRPANIAEDGADLGPATAPAPQIQQLSPDERQQIAAERELLAMLASSPVLVRPHAERMASFLWADPRHEAMAWAMLATPEQTPPAEMVRVASTVVPEATRLLSGGRLSSDVSPRSVGFLLDTVELYSTRRKVLDIRLKLQGLASRVDDDDVTALLRQATELQRHEGELTQSLLGHTVTA